MSDTHCSDVLAKIGLCRFAYLLAASVSELDLRDLFDRFAVEVDEVDVLDLARCNPHDMNGVTDHVRGRRSPLGLGAFATPCTA
jgi:hypothetical protein